MQNFKPLLTALAFLGFLIPSSAHSETIASLYSKQGNVQANYLDSKDWVNANKGQKFKVKEAVRTLKASRAGIRFNDGFLIRLNEKSNLRFNKPGKQKNKPLSVSEGSAYFFSRKPKVFPKVITPQVSASVRGTEFVVSVTKEKTVISVLQGAVLAENKYGETLAEAGEQVLTENGRAPVKQILVNPVDAVQWALYYPKLTEAKNEFPDLTKSAELLSAGQVEQASKLLKQADKTLINNRGAQSIISAQKALIALVRNEKERAKELASQSIKNNPDSTSAMLVSSYVEQSFFNLDSAKNWLEKVLAQDPNHELARARLAEIMLAYGDSDSAITILSSIAKNNSYSETVFGFSELTNYSTEKAIAHFNRAINLDQGFALARLGLGLAKIREGSLTEGRKELEAAAQLDPFVSLYRSYLGKAFFEEDKYSLARNEYTRAIEIDPNDPTPYLYRSFLNLSEHKPIQALKDIQTSIEKNDNRAVYRSRLLLDQDKGVRSTSLGQIYNRIGFTELARVEAIKSLNKDYSNYSAHFLLADLYSRTHLNSRAQTTENLIGRLLVPVNFNSNNINIGGEASLNEYNTLFDRPESQTSLNLAVESETEKVSAQVDYTKADNELGYKFGYATNIRDGFRNNDFNREHQFFTQGQYQVSKKNTLVWDAVASYGKTGDVVINYDPYSEDEDLETELDSYLLRGGIHHQLGVGEHFIAQAFYNYGNFESDNKLDNARLGFIDVTFNGDLLTTVPFPFDGAVDNKYKVKQHLMRADAQYILDTKLVSLIAGASFRHERLDGTETSIISDRGSEGVLDFLIGYPINGDEDVEQNSHRIFVYSKWHLRDWLDLDLGLVRSDVELAENISPPFVDSQFDNDRWSPKLGFTVELPSQTTIRGAYTKTLDRTQRGGIGPLEPTFVGGFNQVFDGIRGSEQDFFALGVDHKFSTETYFGLSYEDREIKLAKPFVESGISIERGSLETIEAFDSGIADSSADERRIEAYFYQILCEKMSGVFNYLWEDFDQSNTLDDFKTNKADFKLNYFHPNGLFAFGGTTWRDQERSLADSTTEENNFWIFDAGLGYEFDHRAGFVRLTLNNIFDKSFRYSSARDEQEALPSFNAKVDFSYNF